MYICRSSINGSIRCVSGRSVCILVDTAYACWWTQPCTCVQSVDYASLYNEFLKFVKQGIQSHLYKECTDLNPGDVDCTWIKH